MHVLFDDTNIENGYLTGVLNFLTEVFVFVFFVCKKKKFNVTTENNEVDYNHLHCYNFILINTIAIIYCSVPINLVQQFLRELNANLKIKFNF